MQTQNPMFENQTSQTLVQVRDSVSDTKLIIASYEKAESTEGHKKRGRPATGRKVLICPYEGCNGKKFRDLFNLRSHLKTHVS